MDCYCKLLSGSIAALTGTRYLETSAVAIRYPVF
jgi:hypothetical protein